MGTNCGKTVRLYASQTEAVWNTICRDGVAFCKEDYIIRKYGTAAPVFLTAYRWFVEKAQAVVPRPAGASFPYWVFADSMMMETGKSSYVLALDVPIEEALFFDMYDWNQILQFHLLSEDPKEARHFLEELDHHDIFSIFSPAPADQFHMIHGVMGRVVSFAAIQDFSQKFRLPLTIMPNAGHRFDNPGEMDRLLDTAIAFFWNEIPCNS